jgi:hypothetical protein
MEITLNLAYRAEKRANNRARRLPAQETTA